MMIPYRERVQKARTELSTDLIYNRDRDHAAVLIEELFTAAKLRVGILSQKLDEQVYCLPSLINAAQAFLEAEEAHLTIVVEETLPEGHEFLRQTRDESRYKGRVTVVDGIGDVYPFNFMVSDGVAYRFEADKGTPSAVACFNGRNIAGPMMNIIDTVAPHSMVREAAVA